MGKSSRHSASPSSHRPLNPNAARRSAARLAAVQVLYAMEMSGIDAGQALAEFRGRQAEEERGPMAEPDAEMVALLVQGAAAESAFLDEAIAKALSRDWSVDRLEAVLRAVLRAGVYELKARPATPARVAISEYVDVAHAFYAGSEPGLVNAVLDRVARTFRPEEFAGGGAAPPA
ncbi:MAG: transcription antitermination factor NusB [Magnetospirillum sp.]|nr:transcription antitermination factor NusB [Magnetospirillum sp.]